MKLTLKKGSTSVRVTVFISDSSSTTGAGKTGLAYTSSGLKWYYWRSDTGNSGGVAVTPVSATRGTFTSGGFIEIDATNMPGWYEIGLPNAALASGSIFVAMHLMGATNMAMLPLEIELVAYDPQDAAALGLTNLDAAITSRLAPTTAGRTLDISSGGEAGIDWANVGSPTTTVSLSGTTVGVATTLTNAPSDSSGTTTLLTRLSNTRAGYLDNLSAGAVALASGVTLASSQSAVTFASFTCTGTFTVSDGIVVTRSTANSTAILVTGSGTGDGICAKSGTGATGVGILGQSQATDGHGISGYGSGSWNGIYGWGGLGTGNGIKGQGGDTSGYGLECTAVSGAAMHAMSLSGYGFQIIATGTNNAAVKLTPGSGGYGIDGILATVATATALTTNNDKTGYSLTSGERTSIANEVEAQIIDDTDSEKVLEAITNKIASVNPSLDDLTLGGIASAVRTELATELARIDAAISTRLASASILLSGGAVTVGTNNDKTGYSLSTTPPTAAAIVTAIRAMEIESGETFDQLIQRMRSVLYGKVAGAATVTNIFYRADGSTVAVRMTVDSDGNRSAVTFT